MKKYCLTMLMSVFFWSGYCFSAVEGQKSFDFYSVEFDTKMTMSEHYSWLSAGDEAKHIDFCEANENFICFKIESLNLFFSFPKSIQGSRSWKYYGRVYCMYNYTSSEDTYVITSSVANNCGKMSNEQVFIFSKKYGLRYARAKIKSKSTISLVALEEYSYGASSEK